MRLRANGCNAAASERRPRARGGKVDALLPRRGGCKRLAVSPSFPGPPPPSPSLCPPRPRPRSRTRTRTCSSLGPNRQGLGPAVAQQVLGPLDPYWARSLHPSQTPSIQFREKKIEVNFSGKCCLPSSYPPHPPPTHTHPFPGALSLSCSLSLSLLSLFPPLRSLFLSYSLPLSFTSLFLTQSLSLYPSPLSPFSFHSHCLSCCLFLSPPQRRATASSCGTAALHFILSFTPH